MKDKSTFLECGLGQESDFLFYKEKKNKKERKKELFFSSISERCVYPASGLFTLMRFYYLLLLSAVLALLCDGSWSLAVL